MSKITRINITTGAMVALAAVLTASIWSSGHFTVMEKGNMVSLMGAVIFMLFALSIMYRRPESQLQTAQKWRSRILAALGIMLIVLGMAMKIAVSESSMFRAGTGGFSQTILK